MTRPLALIVDDEPDICELLGLTLERMQVDSRAAQDLQQARAQPSLRPLPDRHAPAGR